MGGFGERSEPNRPPWRGRRRLAAAPSPWYSRANRQRNGPPLGQGTAATWNHRRNITMEPQPYSTLPAPSWQDVTLTSRVSTIAHLHLWAKDPQQGVTLWCDLWCEAPERWRWRVMLNPGDDN